MLVNLQSTIDIEMCKLSSNLKQIRLSLINSNKVFSWCWCSFFNLYFWILSNISPSTFAEPALSRTEYKYDNWHKCAEITFPFLPKTSQIFSEKCKSWWPSLSLAPTHQLMATEASIHIYLLGKACQLVLDIFCQILGNIC